jgi:hypothetical protein
MLMLNAGAIARPGLMVSILFFATQTHAMTLTGTPSPVATVGQSYLFIPTMKYANPCSSCFHVSGLPGWMHFNSTNGRISGTPSATGSWSNIKITAWNGVDGASLPPFKVTVNAAPLLKITGSPSSSTSVSQYYFFQPTVTASSGSKLSYTIGNEPSWAGFNKSTGALSGTPGSGNVATYSNISISVSNGKTSAALPAFRIAVARAVNGSAVLSWTKPTHNSDGTPLTNLAGYHVHYGTSEGSLNRQVTVGSPNATSASIENLNGGKWYFAMSAYTSAGVDGATSGSVSKTIQ